MELVELVELVDAGLGVNWGVSGLGDIGGVTGLLCILSQTS